MIDTSVLTPDALEAAHERIRPLVHRTPVLTCSALDALCGAELFFKCENFQKVGAFKYRGASNAVAQLNDDERERGVVTHSSGNHAQALALAARMQNVKARIVMPRDAPAVKLAAVRGYGAEVVLCEPTLAAREAGVQKIIEETGAVLVHPFDDPRIIAGQASAAKELLEDVDDLDLLLAPVGGGGLLSGTGLAANAFSPETRVIGAEPSAVDDAYRALETGVRQPPTGRPTAADGLRTSLSELTFALIREHVERVVLVEEDEILAALRLVWERMKIVIEPSCAVPLAAALSDRLDVEGLRVGIILTGGNVDFPQALLG